MLHFMPIKNKLINIICCLHKSLYNVDQLKLIDRAKRPEELLLKEAIHIQSTPAGECLNRDGGKGIPKGWMAALKRSEGTVNR